MYSCFAFYVQFLNVSRNDVGHLLYLTGVFIPIWQRGFSWTVFWQTRYFPTPAVFRYQFFPVVMLLWIQFSVGPVVELWPKSRHFIIASLYVSNVMFNVQNCKATWIETPLSFKNFRCKAGYHHGIVRCEKAGGAETVSQWRSFVSKGYFHSCDYAGLGRCQKVMLEN